VVRFATNNFCRSDSSSFFVATNCSWVDRRNFSAYVCLVLESPNCVSLRSARNFNLLTYQHWRHSASAALPLLPILEIITLARASRLTLFQLLNAIILCNRNYRWICQQWRLMGSHIDTRHVETRWNPFKTYTCAFLV
jgi:hypothetical protein